MAVDWYDAVAHVLDGLPSLMRETRLRRRLSLRQVAAEIDGLSHATLFRYERGDADVTTTHAVLMLRWLATR